MVHILRKKLIHLHRCRGITRRTVWQMLKTDPLLQDLYKSSSAQLSHKYKIPLKNAKMLCNDLHDHHIHDEIKHDLTAYNVITIVDDNYPSVLQTIKDPPIVLYTLGDVELLKHNPALSVIGTRQPTGNAYHKTNHILSPLIQQDWLVVSGMARGIDSYAHQIALNCGGKTIAVLGGGFRYVYPKQNIKLFNRIASQGLILSEYTPSTPPKRYHFPERNRLISGLSFGTLVVEAMERSGTLITVDQALDQGRNVYAIPDSPLLEQAKGCLKMIEEGAKLTKTANDLMEDWKEIQDFWGNQVKNKLTDELFFS